MLTSKERCNGAANRGRVAGKALKLRHDMKNESDKLQLSRNDLSKEANPSEAVISLLAPFHSKIRVKYSKIALQQGWDWEKVMAPCDHIMELRSSFSPHIFVSNVLKNSHFKKTMLLQRQINGCLF